MQTEEVRAFKYDLRAYKAKLNQIQDLENKIEECYYALGGVRGVDPSKEPMHSPPNIEYEYTVRNRIEELERKIKQLRVQTEEVERILNRMETSLKTAIISVYVDGHTIASVARKMYLSHNGLLRRMNREIKKALD